MMTDTEPESLQAGARARQPRAAVTKGERRRRRSGTINRMAQYRLDIFDESQLDRANYVYRWVNEEGSRLRMATKQDDYDYVVSSDLKDFNPDATDSESADRIRMLVGKDANGNPVYSYLLKKRRDFWEADNEDAVEFRENMMAGRVYRGEATEGDDERPEGEDDKFYVPEGVQIGGVPRRRNAPLRRSLVAKGAPK